MQRVLLILLGVAACVGVWMFGATWSAFRTPDCSIPREATRALDPDNQADRDHLKADIALVERTAEHYREYVRTIPEQTQSINAQRTLAARPDRAYRYCVAILNDRVAASHDLAPEQLSAMTER